MPLLLGYLGLNLRSATIIIGFLGVFYPGYRIIKDTTMIIALKDVEGSDYSSDLPKDTIPTLLKVLYLGISAASAMFLCSILLLLGVWKKLPSLIFAWLPVSVIYILLDIAVIAYCAIVYTNVSAIGVTIGIACFWCALQIYFIIVVAFYLKSLTGNIFPGQGYDNLISEA